MAFVAHLRPEKDPLRAALAVRLLPPLSKIRILHAGRALTADLANLAKAEENRNPRYEWLGEVSGRRARSIIARSRLLVLTSRMEGGANVVSEALAARTPVIASRIACTEALLGENYPGFFPVGSTKALARLLGKFEADAAFQRELSLACARQAWKVAPPEERRAWRRVVAWARG